MRGYLSNHEPTVDKAKSMKFLLASVCLLGATNMLMQYQIYNSYILVIKMLKRRFSDTSKKLTNIPYVEFYEVTTLSEEKLHCQILMFLRH